MMGGIALHEVQLSNRGRLLRKELLGAFVNGSTVATGTAGARFAIMLQARWDATRRSRPRSS